MAGTRREPESAAGSRGIDGDAVEEEEPDEAVGIGVLDYPPQPPDHDLQPGLFRHSRAVVWAGVSPGSHLPPGNSQ